MKKKCCLALISIFFSLYSYATSAFVAGLDSYAKSDWKKAIEYFQASINSAKSESEIENALYYLIMSLASNGNYKNAINTADIFVSRYPKSAKYCDIIYQRARLYCLLGFYEKSLSELYSFINQYPTNKSVPSAYYWIGENLYLFGKLQEARDVFYRILINYPSSSKSELAKQRISLIDQVANQEELLTVLKLMQERAKQLESKAKQQQNEENIENVVEEGVSKSDSSALEKERAKNAELYEKLIILEAKNKELLESLALLDQLDEKADSSLIPESTIDEEQKDKEKNTENDETEDDYNDEDEREREEKEIKEKRRLILETLKKKARQLEGMYNELLEEEK